MPRIPNPFRSSQPPNESQALPPGPGQQPQRPLPSTDNPIEQVLGHTTPDGANPSVRPQAGAPPFGASGRANFYGLPQSDELNQKLIGPRGLSILDDMYWSDAHMRRLVLAAWSPVVASTWELEPYAGQDAIDADKKIAETIWRGLNEYMCPNFTGHLYEVGPSLLRFGFTPFEQQWANYKPDGLGKTLLFPRKLGYMMPRTVWKWWQDDFGDLTWIGQILPNKPDVVIPRSELCYYRLAAEGDNWMGRSLLRHAYKHFVFKDRLERIQAIGCERSAKGVPVVYRFPEVSEQILNQLEQALAMLHVSEVGYLMLPGWKMGSAPADADATNQFLVDTVQYNSSSDNSIKDAIDYHQQAISASFLTDFLELGHHQVGARATADIQEDPFLTALHAALMPPILPELNRLVDRIRVLNWPDSKGSPKLKVTLHDDASLTEISSYIQQLQAAGAITIDPELEDWLRERAAMPVANQDIRAQSQQKLQAENEADIAVAQSKAADPDGTKAAAANAKAKQAANPNPMPGVTGGQGKSLSLQGNKQLTLDVSLEENGGISGVEHHEIPEDQDAKFPRKDTVCCDFDGVIHPDGDHNLAEGPLPGAIDGIRKLMKRWLVIISTARNPRDYDAVRAWLSLHGLPDVPVTHLKPPAVAYIDNRAVPFNAANPQASWANINRQLDADFSPMSGGVSSEDGLQMVPETGKSKCPDCGGITIDKNGRCAACGARMTEPGH